MAAGGDSGQASRHPQILILSDGKPGHLNQSIAFARLLGCDWQIRTVRFRNRLFKALSYLFDFLGFKTSRLFAVERPLPPCRMIVSAGSETYYANRVLSQATTVRSVALMLPKGYRLDFDLIVAQMHDRPPQQKNLLPLPVNLSAPVAAGLVERGPVGTPCIAVIIGGPSKHFRFEVKELERQLQQVFRMFPGGDFLVTTSRRTPAEVDALLEGMPFRYRLLYSQRADNPVADFLNLADYLFITEDSTSMVSEAVCWGEGKVEILPLQTTGRMNKVRQMIDHLADRGCLHRFDGTLGNKGQKIKLREELIAFVPDSWLVPICAKSGGGSI